jgi:mono/diheme cytochrome c family protein
MKIRRLIAAAAAVLFLAVVCFLGYVFLAPVGPDPVSPVAGIPSDMPAGMSRGEYLAKAADCVACHTAQGGKEFIGGRAFQLPFGTIYSTNLTPDAETGIGGWSDDQFVEAVRAGVGSKGHLYPAMPYTSYSAMSRDDVLAIKGYLFSLAPVHAATPENTLSFPFNQRWGMKFWDIAFFRQHRFVPDQSQSEEWNRGAYLAGALGHCGECHTPRNIGFAMESHDYLAGTVIEGWKAYNTTSDQAYGIGGWTDQQLLGYLSNGHAEGRSSASGPMAEVVENSLQYMSPNDIHALMSYLRSVAPINSSVANAVIETKPAAASASNAVLAGGDTATDHARGQRLFEGSCAGCHQFDGAGRQNRYASLVGSHAVNDPDGAALIQVLLHGTSIRIGTKENVMPSFAGAYSDADIAALSNYVLAHFGSKHGTVTPEQVAQQRQAH